MPLAATRRTCLGLALASVLPAGAARAQQAEKPIRIGFIATLSGPLGPLGKDAYDAFMLAVDANGGKLGGRPVEVLAEDDHFKVDDAVQIVTGFTQRDKVDLVVASVFSNIAIAIAKPVTDAKTVFISAAAGPTPLAGEGCSPLAFNTSTLNQSAPEAMGQLMTAAGIKRAYVMAPNYEAGHDVVDGFKRYFQGTLAGESFTTLNQPDFQAELSTVRAAKPDAMFAFYFGAMAPTFFKQYRQAGLGRTPLYTFQAVDATTLPAIGDAAIGTHLVNLWNDDLDNAANQRFVAAYKAKYHRVPMDYGARAFDTAQLLDAALRASGGRTEPAAFRRSLLDAQFDSVRGKFAFNPANQFPIQDVYALDVVRGSDGKPAIVTKGVVTEKRSDLVASQCRMPRS